MKALLGIDGGGTKTKLILSDVFGHNLAENIQPTGHYLQGGLERLSQVLKEGVAAVCQESRIPPEDIIFAFVGCPGFGDTASMTPAILAAVDKALSPIPHGVGNDCENALAGALAGQPGINLIAGTGSMGCGRNAEGRVLRCGGWHHAIGSDEGSGYWLSIQMLLEFTRQSDGRDPKTPLYDAIKKALDITIDGDVITKVVDVWQMDRTKIAALCPLIGELYDLGDPYAAKILQSAAEELYEMASALYRQLGFSGVVPVSGTGGVFQLGERLWGPLGEKLANGQMQLVSPRLPPDRGSLILAFQQSGTPVPQTLLQA